MLLYGCLAQIGTLSVHGFSLHQTDYFTQFVLSYATLELERVMPPQEWL
jgi:hypothetical protein